MLVYCVNDYIRYIIERFLASTFWGGNFAKNPLEVLWQTVCRGMCTFSKKLLSDNYFKTSPQPKKDKPSNGMDYVFPPEFSTRLNPAGV